jgi:hypothetical protein
VEFLITVGELRDFLGIDYEDEMVDANIQLCINSALAWADGGVCRNFEDLFGGDARARQLMLVVAGDFYNNRDYEGKYSGLRSRLITDIVTQLKVEAMEDGI